MRLYLFMATQHEAWKIVTVALRGVHYKGDTMLKLKPENYAILQNLSSTLHDRPTLQGVLHAGIPGDVYVDDDRPTTACVVTKWGFCYLLGDYRNETFLAALKKELTQAVFPRYRQQGETAPVLYGDDPNWNAVIEQMLPQTYPLPAQRVLFHFDVIVFHQLKKSVLPSGCTLVFTHKDAFDHEKNPEIIADITTTWPTVDAFCALGFGAALAQDGKIISHCFSVFPGTGSHELSVWTAEAHRGNGFASIVAWHWVQCCLDADITPVWECWVWNAPSMALAKKLGFVQDASWPARFCFIDPLEAHAVNVQHHYHAKNYEQCLMHIDALIESSDTDPDWRVLKAVCYAALHNDDVWSALEDAISAGVEVALLQEKKELTRLQTDPRWKTLMASSK